MNIIELINKKYNEGDLSSIYDHLMNSNYSDYKKAYMEGDNEFKEAFLKVKTKRGNNLFQIAVAFKDFALIKEILNLNSNQSLSINNESVFYHLEYYDENEKNDIKKLFLEKINNNEFKIDSINYAYAVIEIFKKSYAANIDEFKQDYLFNEIYSSIYNDLKKNLNLLSVSDQILFLAEVIRLKEGYDNGYFLKREIDKIFDLIQDKDLLINTILKGNDFIKNKLYILNNNFNPTEKNGKWITEIENDLLQIINLTDQNKNQSYLQKESKKLIEKIESKKLYIEDLESNNFLVFQKSWKILTILLNITDNKTYKKTDFLYNIIENHTEEIFDYHVGENYFADKIKKNEYSNFIIHKERLYDQELADSLFNEIEKIPELFKNIIKMIPLIVVPEISISDSNGCVETFNDYPIALKLFNIEDKIIVHELTHVLQLINENVTNKSIEQNDIWKEIKQTVVNESNVSQKQLVEFIIKIIDPENQDDCSAIVNINLDKYMKTQQYNFDLYLKKNKKEESNLLINALFKAYRKQNKENAFFLSSYWNALDKKKYYYGDDLEIHARLNELIYCKKENEIENSLTLGIKNQKEIIEKIRPLLDKLNNMLFDEIKNVKKQSVSENIKKIKNANVDIINDEYNMTANKIKIR